MKKTIRVTLEFETELDPGQTFEAAKAAFDYGQDMRAPHTREMKLTGGFAQLTGGFAYSPAQHGERHWTLIVLRDSSHKR